MDADKKIWFAEIREALNTARNERETIEARLALIDSPRILTLHPNLADHYRLEIEALEQLLTSPYSQADAVPRFRSFIGRIVVSPAERGVHISVEGRMDQLLGLAGAEPRDLRKAGRRGAR